jgi:hypothetical protein
MRKFTNFFQKTGVLRHIFSIAEKTKRTWPQENQAKLFFLLIVF